MKKLILLGSICIMMCIANQAMALTFTLNPSSISIANGGSVFLDLNVSGLTAGGPDSLGAFAMDINYDSSVMLFDDVIFSGYLGDIGNFEADGYFDDSLPGTVYLDEISWLFDDELDALQGSSFTLATLEFTGIGFGSSNFDMANIVASDALGASFSDIVVNDTSVRVSDFQPVPEPATLVLLGLGLFGFVGLKKKIL